MHLSEGVFGKISRGSEGKGGGGEGAAKIHLFRGTRLETQF